jgi:hypothetical protein
MKANTKKESPHRNTGINVCYLPLEINLKANFSVLQCHISTGSELPKVSSSTNEDNANVLKPPPPKYGYLAIHIESPLDKVDGTFELPLYSRPRFLILLSLLAYLTDYPFSVYSMRSSFMGVIGRHNLDPDEIAVEHFIVDGRDKSGDLRRLLSRISGGTREDRTFIFSLLDRWRKALYLQTESEALLYDDEALLAYFHTLELLADTYKDKLTSDVESAIHSFLEQTLPDTFKLRERRLRQEEQEKFKIIRTLLLSVENLSVTTKICYLIDQLGLLNDKSQSLVEQLVKARNAVAHGRQVYREEMIWPVPPFFPLDIDSAEHLSGIKVLSARAIARHLGLEAWDKEWKHVVKQLHPSHDVIISFIEKSEYKDIPSSSFLSGRRRGVRPSSIVETYLSRKIDYKKMELALWTLLETVAVEERNVDELLLAAVLLADSKDQHLADRCRSIIEEIRARDLIDRIILEEVLRYLEYRKFRPEWLRRWIESREHMGRGREYSAPRVMLLPGAEEK